jgi:transcriptional regulator with XRE-family HTH domain
MEAGTDSLQVARSGADHMRRTCCDGLPERIRAVRAALGLGRPALAQKMAAPGSSPASIATLIYRYERGSYAPSIEVLRKLYEVTGFDVGWLVTGRAAPMAVAWCGALQAVREQLGWLPPTIGLRIRWARRVAGLSQRALAEAVGTDVMRVSKWEREVAVPTAAATARVADALGVSTHWLITGSVRQGRSLQGVA